MRVSAAVGLCLAGALLAALAALAADAEGAVELIFWGLPDKPASNAPGAAALKRFEQFLDENPDLTVKQGGGPQLQRFGRGPREFLMAQAGGIGPDVVGDMADVDLQDYASRRFLYPLDEFLKEAGMWDDIRRSPFLRHIESDGHVYALPTTPRPGTLVLVYRKDMFEQVGLDRERPPKTWDEFLEYAERLTEPRDERFGFVLPTDPAKGGAARLGAGGFLELAFALNGVEVVRKDDEGKWVADFADDPRAVQAMEFVKKLLGRRIERDGKEYRGLYTTCAGTVDDSIKFDERIAAMMVQTMEELCWHRARTVPIADVGVAPLPLGPSGDGFVPLVTRYMGVNALSPTEARRRGAWRWVRYNQRTDLRRINAQAYIDWNWAEFADPRDMEGDPELGGLIEDIPAQWREVYRTMLDRARALPLCPHHRRLRRDYLARPVAQLRKDPDMDARRLLLEIQGTINKEVLGSIPPAVRKKQRSVALVVVAVAALALLVAFVYNIRGLAKTLGRDKDRGTVYQAGRRRIYMLAGLFMIPAVGSVVLWMYLPLVRGVMIAFQDYQIVGAVQWVGLDNFIAVLTDKLFWISLLRTVQYGILSLSLGFVAPIVLAFLLAEVPRAKVLFRVVFYLPALTSGLIIMFLWKWMYDPTPRGLLNTIIAWAGALIGVETEPCQWLDSENLAMISVVLPTVWAGVGPGCIIYLAALSGLPDDLYEAADLDGAGWWQKIWHVSIPFMKPLIIINFVGAFIATFHTMQNIFVMTQGGPGDSTYVVGIYIFFNSFIWLQFGKATAAAWILGSLLIGFTIYQLRILRDLKFQTAATDEE